MFLLCSTPNDLANGAGPLVCAVIWFVALADRKAWFRASLVFSVFIAIMLRRMSQAMLSGGGVHQLLYDLSGHQMLMTIDTVWIICGLMMIKPLPTEVRSPDARHGFHMGSAMAVWASRFGLRSYFAGAGEGAKVLGQCLAHEEPGAAVAGCDRRAAGEADSGVVRRGDQVAGPRDRRTPKKVAAAIGIAGVIFASMGGYIIHLTIKDDIAKEDIKTLTDMRISEISAAYNSRGNRQ